MDEQHSTYSGNEAFTPPSSPYPSSPSGVRCSVDKGPLSGPFPHLADPIFLMQAESPGAWEQRKGTTVAMPPPHAHARTRSPSLWTPRPPWWSLSSRKWGSCTRSLTGRFPRLPRRPSWTSSAVGEAQGNHTRGPDRNRTTHGTRTQEETKTTAQGRGGQLQRERDTTQKSRGLGLVPSPSWEASRLSQGGEFIGAAPIQATAGRMTQSHTRFLVENLL